MWHSVLARNVVVGNDQINAKPARGFRSGESPDAGVHTDNEANACGCGGFDDIATKIVSLMNSMRNVKVGSAAAEFNCSLENDDGKGAIDIVIAVNQHAFFAFDRGGEPVDGGFHALHEIWGMEMSDGRREISLNDVRLVDPANKK